ncbi:MAG: T9SS type A sorting domain-containing protein [Bacteroidetes bacterium]|nr:T9SS type A sorting domain-containing protein [Bacteroidota bacterium]
MFKQKIIPLLLLFFCFSLVQGYSQPGFIFRYSTSLDEYPNDIIETSDGGFIISISIGTYPLDYQTLLIRLDQYGDTIRTKKIIVPGGTCFIYDIVKLDNGNYMGLGLKKPDSISARLWLLTLSDSLTVINDTTFSTVFTYCWNLYGLINHMHNIIIYGDAIPHTDPPSPNPFVFLISQSSDSLFSHYYINPWGQMVFSMIEKKDTSGYLMSLEGSMNGPSANSPCQFIKMDYDFNITSTDSVPGSLEAYLIVRTISAGEYMITGLKHIWNSNPRTDKIGILKLDTSFHIKKEFFFGPDDTVSYPAYNTNLDFLNVNNIFLGGVANQDWGGVFSYNLSYIILGKFDSSLNLSWQKYYGGDMYYMVWSVIATTDGGCIIGASSNDYAVQGEERDIYILKVDSNGLITGINNHPPDQTNQVVIYPNPGNDLLYVETQLKNAVFHLFDLTGREILNSGLSPGRNSIQVRDINSGLYIYKVIQNSQVKECGKWIKE